MRHIVLASLIVAVVLGLAGAGLAQDHTFHRMAMPPGAGPHMAFMMDGGPLAEELGLTDEQKAAVKQLHEELMAQAKPLIEQHHKQMEEIHSLLDAGNASAEEIGTKVIAAHETGNQLKALHDANKDRFTALLTEEQRAKLKELEASHPHPDHMMFFHPGF
jgi:Spy/CpxP family protein refolding chaperone